MQNSTQNNTLRLNGLDLNEIEVFFEQGSKGMPAFAASCGTNCNVANSCSCTVKKLSAQ